ncbi:hypothetical protein D9Q98_010291 [Chlorella vulgaris]|uniref:DRBM domain-containing protein n=1 Tax=Chlorella vulgaris TaxID=3077 RepID=A0A9D4TJW1_CHLVU|nr:hypothetical protein D9Q98_010291 [Chlorella vulgaris]
MYRANGGWPQPSQQHFSHYGADHVAGYSAFGGGSQPAGIAGFRASQPLPLDPWIEAGGRRDRGRSTGGRAGRHRSHAAKSGRRASASAEAAQLSSLPADVAGDYLQDYPGVNNVLQRFKSRGKETFPLAMLNEYATRLSFKVEFRLEPATRAGGFRVDVRLASKKDGETVEGAVGQARNKQAGKQVAAAALLQQLLDTGVLSEADLLAPSGKEEGKKKSWQAPQHPGLGADPATTTSTAFRGHGGSGGGSRCGGSGGGGGGYGRPGAAFVRPGGVGFVRGGTIVPKSGGFELEPCPGSAAARGGYGAVSVTPFLPAHRPPSLQDQVSCFQAASLPNASKQFTSSGAVRTAGTAGSAFRSTTPHTAGTAGAAGASEGSMPPMPSQPRHRSLASAVVAVADKRESYSMRLAGLSRLETAGAGPGDLGWPMGGGGSLAASAPAELQQQQQHQPLQHHQQQQQPPPQQQQEQQQWEQQCSPLSAVGQEASRHWDRERAARNPASREQRHSRSRSRSRSHRRRREHSGGRRSRSREEGWGDRWQLNGDHSRSRSRSRQWRREGGSRSRSRSRSRRWRQEGGSRSRGRSRQ